MANLLEALDCEDEERVIEGFINRYNVTRDEALDIFIETKKWLWLGANYDEPERALFIDQSIAIIDEMWHNFLLYSKVYYNFCINRLKKIVHHEPLSHAEVVKTSLKSQHDSATYEQLVKHQYNVIYDKLGKDTLVKWYDTFATKYTPEYIQSIKKHQAPSG